MPLMSLEEVHAIALAVIFRRSHSELDASSFSVALDGVDTLPTCAAYSASIKSLYDVIQKCGSLIEKDGNELRGFIDDFAGMDNK